MSSEDLIWQKEVIRVLIITLHDFRNRHPSKYFCHAWSFPAVVSFDSNTNINPLKAWTIRRDPGGIRVMSRDGLPNSASSSLFGLFCSVPNRPLLSSCFFTMSGKNVTEYLTTSRSRITPAITLQSQRLLSCGVLDFALSSLNVPNTNRTRVLFGSSSIRTDPNKGIDVRNPDKHEPNEGAVQFCSM